MSLKQIIIIVSVCIVCFGASFGIAWLTKPDVSIETVEPNSAKIEVAPNDPLTEILAGPGNSINDQSVSRGMSERQLKLLVQSLRTKIEEYDAKLTELSTREEQLAITRQAFAADVNGLNTLRIELASSAAEIKRQKKELEEYQTKISADELVNLKRTAAIYDKMDSTSSSRILINMCKSKQISDAVKILNYMSERSAAKVIGEIGAAEPQIAADICHAIKRIKEL